MSRIGKEWWQVIYFAGHLEKVVLKNGTDRLNAKKRRFVMKSKN